jgi:hypothetical protein
MKKPSRLFDPDTLSKTKVLGQETPPQRTSTKFRKSTFVVAATQNPN